MKRFWLIVAILATALGACREREDRKGPADPPMSHGTAESDAICAEHGVLEAVCTKCNPALIPVFKAKGDWCEEHGFPESICPICHPDRGGRPKAALSGDQAPADGTRVRFKTKDTARLAGLGVVRVAEAPIRSQLVATARIVYDATRSAEVNARSPGVVVAIHAEVGAKVRSGTPLAVIESAGVGADQSRLQASSSRVGTAEANYARVKRLHEEGIAAESEVLEARQELDEAKAELSSARAALGMVGGTADGSARYTITAPIPGLVTQRRAGIGRLVDTEEVFFEIVDPSMMWAEIDVPEADLPRVSVGRPVTLVVDGLGEREFSGVLSYVAPAIDPHTRTAKGRVSLANPDGALRANMFARARIAVTDSRPAVLVPSAAVQRARGAQIVFVRLAEDLYEARRVQVGTADGDLVEVTGRIKPGEDVVTEGSFLLKTETLKESIGAGCCEVEEGR